MQSYTPEFKRDAVSLVIASGRAIKQIAKELGINDTTLGTWVRADRNNASLTRRRGYLAVGGRHRRRHRL